MFVLSLSCIEIFRMISKGIMISDWFFLYLLVSSVASWVEPNFRDYLRGKGSWMSHQYAGNGTGIQHCLGVKSIYVSVIRHCTKTNIHYLGIVCYSATGRRYHKWNTAICLKRERERERKRRGGSFTALKTMVPR